MQAANTTIGSLLNGNKQFIIPVFQRDYTWSRRNWRQLWDDILRAGSDSAGRGHFVGSIVHVPDIAFAASPSYLVIDGQQRLTTLTILFTAFRDHITDNPPPNDNGVPTPEQVDLLCVRNTAVQGDLRYKLALRHSDRDTLWAIADGKPLDNLIGNKSDLIENAYKYFREMLNSTDVDLASIYQGAAGLRIVEISLDPDLDEPQAVFESMNSTGVSLAPSDLVRNYLLMGLPESEQTRLYEGYWLNIETMYRGSDGKTDTGALDQFLSDYIPLKLQANRRPQVNQVYNEFKAFKNRQDPEITVETLLDDMRRFAGYYAAFTGRKPMPTARLSATVRNVRSRGISSALLVMRLYELYENGALTETNFVRSLKYIECYLFRRAILGFGTYASSYWSIFTRIAHALTGEDSPWSMIQGRLASQGQYYWPWRFPNDDEFRQALQEYELYWNRGPCKELLDRLENEGQREPSPVSEYTIEHIMPQGLTDEWRCMLGENADSVHGQWLPRLGNLTLTAHNPEMSNHPFEQKKTRKGGFNGSAVRLNQYVRKQSEWTAEQMEERGRILAERALEIWPYPQIS